MRVRLKSGLLVRESLPGFVLHGSKGSFLKNRTDVQETNLLAGKMPNTTDWGTEPESEKGLLHTEKDGAIIREKIQSLQGNYYDYYDGVYKALKNGGTMPVTADDGINVMRIIEAAIQSSDEKKVIAFLISGFYLILMIHLRSMFKLYFTKLHKKIILMATKNWVIDPSHSEVQFKIKHLMITNVTGSFDLFEASVQTEDEDFMKAKVRFNADINSISTGDEQRDAHLKSAEFFDAATYPKLQFVATGFENVDNDGSYELYGDLTIRDVTKNIKLDVEFGGVVQDAYGNTKAGFSINGKIQQERFWPYLECCYRNRRRSRKRRGKGLLRNTIN